MTLDPYSYPEVGKGAKWQSHYASPLGNPIAFSRIGTGIPRILALDRELIHGGEAVGQETNST
jgi:hypothetical protein